ncbi:MAG TPA: DUF4249 domain-containing protein [Saprospiraceae bacterium]|nr:DUF4249 domain-containing protein [Saprospiraceae bacterium]
MRRNLIFLYFAQWIFISACIDPHSIENTSSDEYVIVDGLITTEPGPHTIKLFRSAPYGNNFESVIQPLPNAKMVIRDHTGNIESLVPSNEIGVYITSPSFSARIGYTYTLHIELQDGRLLSSLPEKVLPVPSLDSLSVTTLEFPSENPLVNRSGAQIVAHFRDPSDEKNYYQWVPKDPVYVLIANPEEFRKGPNGIVDGRLCPYCPCPKECCARCYRTEGLAFVPVSILDDISFNGEEIAYPVYFVEDNGLRFKDTYRIDIYQRSISEKAYRYLLLSKQQLESQGNIFDPPPANIRGNIVQLDQSDMTVLGYFYASDVSSKQIYIKRNDLNIHQPQLLIPDDCREVPNASLDSPSDWNPR